MTPFHSSPSNFEVKVVSASGHLAHEGKHYHIGEAFANKRKRPARCLGMTY
jgi:hypothetical protein